MGPTGNPRPHSPQNDITHNARNHHLRSSTTVIRKVNLRPIRGTPRTSLRNSRSNNDNSRHRSPPTTSQDPDDIRRSSHRRHRSRANSGRRAHTQLNRRTNRSRRRRTNHPHSSPQSVPHELKVNGRSSRHRRRPNPTRDSTSMRRNDGIITIQGRTLNLPTHETVRPQSQHIPRHSLNGAPHHTRRNRASSSHSSLPGYHSQRRRRHRRSHHQQRRNRRTTPYYI